MTVVLHGMDTENPPYWWGWSISGLGRASGFVDPVYRADFFEELKIADQSSQINVRPRNLKPGGYWWTSVYAIDTTTGRGWHGYGSTAPQWTYSGSNPAMSLFRCCASQLTLPALPTVEAVLAAGDSGAGYTKVWHPPAGTSGKYLIVGIGFNGPDWAADELIGGMTWQPDSDDLGTYQSLSRLGRVVGANMSLEIWGLANPADEVGTRGRLHAGPGTASDRTAYCAAWLSGVTKAPTISAGSTGTGTAAIDTYSATWNLALNWGSILLTSPLTAALGLSELAEYQLSTAVHRISTAMGSEVATGSGTTGWAHNSAEWACMTAVFGG